MKRHGVPPALIPSVRMARRELAERKYCRKANEFWIGRYGEMKYLVIATL